MPIHEYHCRDCDTAFELLVRDGKIVTYPHCGSLRVTGLDERGKAFERLFEGFDAVVVHHEIDHLDGVLFIDRVESIEDLYRVAAGESGELVRVHAHIRWT